MQYAACGYLCCDSPKIPFLDTNPLWNVPHAAGTLGRCLLQANRQPFPAIDKVAPAFAKYLIFQPSPILTSPKAFDFAVTETQAARQKLGQIARDGSAIPQKTWWTTCLTTEWMGRKIITGRQRGDRVELRNTS